MKSLNHILTNFLERSDNSRENNKARARCQRKAKKLGITITIERDSFGNAYWLEGTGWDDDNYCADWFEVEEKLQRVAND